ncbi:hypothetical protein ACR79M_08470 [Sphingobacterium spiritivorum]|uniref:hypothetical protein n=1 Tax=Sphingobacterium spiritivorum TaxID=258 RepID=UPI003DA2D8EA
MALDLQSTYPHENGKVFLVKDERHFESTSSNCKMVPLNSLKIDSSYGFIVSGSVNQEYLNNFIDELIDIKFKTISLNFPIPNDKVISTFLSYIELLDNKGVKIENYTPIEEAGLLFDFKMDDKRFTLEIYNDNTSSLYVVNDVTGEPILMDDTSIDDSIKIIEEMI